MNIGTAQTRQRREWRQRIAARLIQLADEAPDLSSDSATEARRRLPSVGMMGNELIGTDTGTDIDTILSALTLSTIDELPLWCALDDQTLSHWQCTAGALFISPALRRCLQGGALQKAAAMLGEMLLHRVLREQGLPDQAPAISRDTDIDALIRTSGGAILLSRLAEPSLIPLYADRLGVAVRTASLIDDPVARVLYERMQNLLTASPSDHAAVASDLSPCDTVQAC